MKSWQTSGGTSITRVILGRSNVFLVSRGNSGFLVDTGAKGDGKKLVGILSQQVRLDAVIMTHTHFDHTGNAALLKEHFSPLFMVHESEKFFLESGDSPLPRGTMAWTRIIYKLESERIKYLFHVPGVKPDITFSDRYDLSPLGFNAFVLHTPGHSSGSSSVIIDNEIAIVGDTMGGFLPGTLFPPWGDDPDALLHSWKLLLETGCHSFHPAHGFPRSRGRLEVEYFKRRMMNFITFSRTSKFVI
jgi:hydroxyacylglutathione hydrolase